MIPCDRSLHSNQFCKTCQNWFRPSWRCLCCMMAFAGAFTTKQQLMHPYCFVYCDKTWMKIVLTCFTKNNDCCNGLLFGLPESQTMKLQRIQNACARLVCNSSKFCHITPLLKTLHWLPVRQRIVFKILLIVFKALNGQAPSYILELLTLKSNSHSHNLRSSNDTLLLKMPTCKTKVTLGDRAFSCAAPKIWNNLPLSIRKSQSVTSFKTKLKTHLFVQAFQ